MNSKAFYAIAAVATIAAAISTGVQADEVDGSQYALKFESSRARAEVRAEAAQAVRLGLTSHGEVGTYASRFEGSRARAEVRAEAAQAVRLASTSHGEVGSL